ncbi:MAG: hypothetical protein KC561_13580, partial [Myxococcales bacterium]|nr:hypothetical protein [Myxococcales bacterium]
HVALTHGRSASEPETTSEDVANALRALDRNGDGALDESELEGHIEQNGNRGPFIVRLPTSCRPAQR